MKSLRDEKPWVLKRQDDNGNVFDIDSFADKEEAAQIGREYELRGHKQVYFVERIKPGKNG